MKKIIFNSLSTFLCACMVCALLLAPAQVYAQNFKSNSGKIINQSSTSRLDAEIQNAKELKVVLVMDRSSSMAGKSIDELNDALRLYFEGIKHDPLLNVKVHLAIVTFESKVEVLRDFRLVGNDTAPKLTTDGSTNMAAAFTQVSSMLNGITPNTQVLKPVVILITDGQPDDVNKATQNAQIMASKAHFYALGVSGAQISFLNSITNNNASMLDGANLGDFFGGLSTSLSVYVKNNLKNSLSAGQPFSMQNWKK